jgi:hypothetical protein
MAVPRRGEEGSFPYPVVGRGDSEVLVRSVTVFVAQGWPKTVTDRSKKVVAKRRPNTDGTKWARMPGLFFFDRPPWPSEQVPNDCTLAPSRKSRAKIPGSDYAPANGPPPARS